MGYNILRDVWFLTLLRGVKFCDFMDFQLVTTGPVVAGCRPRKSPVAAVSISYKT